MVTIERLGPVAVVRYVRGAKANALSLAAVDALLDDTQHARGEFQATRLEVAQAIRGETLDRGAIDGVFERHDQVIDRVRQNALDSFAKVHETLDPRQRKILAELIEAGPFARGFGPFR